MLTPMADTFSAESRLIHAGTDRTPGGPGTPPLAPTSIYVSAGRQSYTAPAALIRMSVGVESAWT